MGNQKDDVIKAFADAYHLFAIQNKGLYRLIMSIPSEDDDKAKEMAVPILTTLVSILSEYNLNEKNIVHCKEYLGNTTWICISRILGFFYYYDERTSFRIK